MIILNLDNAAAHVKTAARQASVSVRPGKPRFARYVRAREDVTLKEHIVDDSSRENVIRILKEMGQFERNNGELFKASSYFRAAKGIEDIPLTEESILAVKGIGKSLCKKILEIVILIII